MFVFNCFFTLNSLRVIAVIPLNGNAIEVPNAIVKTSNSIKSVLPNRYVLLHSFNKRKAAAIGS